jgi:hypothetical protein
MGYISACNLLLNQGIGFSEILDYINYLQYRDYTKREIVYELYDWHDEIKPKVLNKVK